MYKHQPHPPSLIKFLSSPLARQRISKEINEQFCHHLEKKQRVVRLVTIWSPHHLSLVPENPKYQSASDDNECRDLRATRIFLVILRDLRHTRARVTCLIWLHAMPRHYLENDDNTIANLHNSGRVIRRNNYFTHYTLTKNMPHRWDDAQIFSISVEITC